MNLHPDYISIEKAWQLSNAEISNLFANHINSYIVKALKSLKFDRKFIKAEGAYVWDESGTKYMDFCSGFGSVNIGHNHPKIIEILSEYLNKCPPNLLQASTPIFTSALAKNLALIAPGELEISYFSCSGAEAVEGALKLARIATGRTKIVYADNSFHGRTLGALSVTGREHHRKPFEPLIPESICVPYGDLNALKDVLKKRDVAAFIVEPVQGEGGVIIPPNGYLKEAESVCKKAGALFIVDEIQTGFGRTGKMFASEHDNLAPDVLIFAKSIGGAIVPLSGYITTKKIWENAYGSWEKFLLHSSTFSGNNLASMIGIRTIEIIYNENMMENTEEMGKYFLENLNSRLKKYQIVSDIRGKGLMIAVEFSYPFKRNMIGNLINKTSEMITPYWVFSKLFNDHKIIVYGFMNNANVLRIMPPLSVKKEEIDYFLDSLEAVCKEYKGFFNVVKDTVAANLMPHG